MARPIKTKLDYFPIDCTDDTRITLIEYEYGIIAYAVYVKLLQKVYGEKGYYADWDEDSLLMFAGKNRLDAELVSGIIDSMLKRGIFCKELYDKYGILTSAEIQEQCFFVISRRKVKEIDERFRLIDSEKTGVNADNNTHSIVEDSIVKDSIGEKREKKASPSHYHKKKYGKYLNVELTDDEYNKLTSEYSDHSARIDRLSEYIAMSGKSYASHYAVIKSWAHKDKPKERNSSFDIDEFFEAAVRRGENMFSLND